MRKTEPLQIQCFVDSSHANDVDKRSLFGFIIYLNGNVVHFQSKKNTLCSLSSTEAEYTAFCYSLIVVEWIRNFLDELGLQLQTVILYDDNQSAVRMINEKNSMHKNKHIDIRLQAVKAVVLTGDVTTHYVQSSENVADILTKPLGLNLFCSLRQRMFNSADGVPRTKEGVKQYTV